MRKISLIFRVLALLCISVLLTVQNTVAGGLSVDVNANGIALKGYDPVAYFAAGKSTMGGADRTARTGGATYHFASAENHAQFIADPAKYSPAYGGFCALGVTRSMKITGDPVAWKIVNDKLYINSSPESLIIWSKDISGNIKKANEAWPAIKDKDPAQL